MTEGQDAPAWFAQVGVVFGLVGTAAAAFLAGFKGWKDRPKRASEAQNTLIAGDIMDTRPMKDLAAAVDRLADGRDRTVSAIDHNTVAVDRMERAIRDMCDAYDRSQR